ncbi:2-C-methyl-D-erythritol 4-phosphate cytidylyltransferase [Novimethylophilus kurashikiensis]|uniref:2-C-methyl-D-erythritol 4-phosphate cytidylyltransferase n=1 Tax=Novimethylophilus kurashikiensis TaxID=1825523 RepID=A0A2R5F9I9_9PROT|nr:CocE/NonD family hydrolase [Novimethylophilus kurashikiensis]GBG13304.1 2-C-methyl-D-erythritol 4-phosphate cytidylyltransferase [Novimethylophilus kurashikiensis]
MLIATFAAPLARCLLGFLILIRLSIPLAAQAADAGDEPLDPQLNERIIYVPIQQTPLVRLQVTVFTPPGAGPFPLAVLNHGKNPGMPENEKRYRSVYAARYFLSRGYAVVIPMMRGFAGSDGDTWVTGCNLEAMAVHHGQDLARVIEYLVNHPDAGVPVESGKVVIFGQSMGGWNTLGAGSLNIPGVKGLVNFAGGLNAPDCLGWQGSLAAASGHFGQNTQVPSLWFYGDNDSKFAVPVWRNMLKQYNQGGEKAEIVAYGNFMRDSHGFLGSLEALPVWMPKMDAFLAKIGLPAEPLHAELLPAPYPAATNFADIGNIDALPLVNEPGREAYKTFLKKSLPKAFVIADDGATYTTVGGYDPLQQAMSACKRQHQGCEVYAVNDKVVWEQSQNWRAKSAVAESFRAWRKP